ncbi:ATP-binding protein [Pokkaliibacter sp. CJK22405]|uniref:ATP-binding protein n=1 Tax=Pokkaliibacter sp. CJK22405 TaxID=3384615 RepID=UPI0039846805
MLLATIATVVMAAFVVFQWSFQRGFIDYLHSQEQTRIQQVQQEACEMYDRYGGWPGIVNNESHWRRIRYAGNVDADIIVKTLDEYEQRTHMPLPDWSKVPLSDGDAPFEARLALYDTEKNWLIGNNDTSRPSDFYPVTCDKQNVGFIGVVMKPEMLHMRDQAFTEEQSQSFIILALVTVFVAALVAWPVAQRLSRPLKALSNASHKLANGEYTIRLDNQSRDELGRLARDFNRMAQTLQSNEESRRRWMAGIAHELRTPLAILQGEIEAIQDGIRPLNHQSVASLHHETQQLKRLVDDLYELALSDRGVFSYRMEDIDLIDCIEQSVESSRLSFAEKALELNLDLGTLTEIPLKADYRRLSQLFTNLLSNSIRYTDSPGQCRIEASLDDDWATIDVMDSSPAMPAEDLPRMFERFFRGDESRNRASGGAGLGLSICKNIVEAHNGTIDSRISPLGGIWIRIRLPLDS